MRVLRVITALLAVTGRAIFIVRGAEVGVASELFAGLGDFTEGCWVTTGLALVFGTRGDFAEESGLVIRELALAVVGLLTGLLIGLLTGLLPGLLPG